MTPRYRRATAARRGRSVAPLQRLMRVLGAVALVSLIGAGPVDSPVADAAMRGDADQVRTLLDAGADVNAAQGDGMTALHWAALNGSQDLVGLLVDRGAELEPVTRLGAYRPLHLAARGGHTEAVRVLVDAGADVSAPTSSGGALPLHMAADAGDPGAVQALLDGGADPDATEEAWGQTALMFAASNDRADAIRTLLAAGADPSVTSKVIDVAARAVADRTDQRLRDAAVRAGWSQGAYPDMARAQAVRDSIAKAAAESQEALGPTAREEGRMIEEPEPLSYAELVGGQGGLTALVHAAREGHRDAVHALLEGGADIDQPSEGDHTTPILSAFINGHFDLGLELLDLGADATIASQAGTTPLFATINSHWAPKARFPQQRAHLYQEATYLETMERLLQAGVDPDARLAKHLWYMSYNFDLLRIDVAGATAFWRAAYALDVEAMKLLVEYGADPNLATVKVPQRSFGRRGAGEAEGPDPSGLPPVPVGGPAVYPIHAATGVGYGQGFAANSHRHVPDGWLPAVKYLVEELGADVNQRDHEGYNPVHHAASRGDNELLLYLIDQGADIMAVSRSGQTTVDLANGPYQRTQPFPETVALLESLGAINNHNCVSC